MSWFDTSSFSSFAKTALSQAQNLQKSIDRVLDIEDDRSSSPSRLPPGNLVFILFFVNIFFSGPISLVLSDMSIDSKSYNCSFSVIF